MGEEERTKWVGLFFCSHLNHGDHWGRIVNRQDTLEYEIDGNALVILGLFNLYRYKRKEPDVVAYILATYKKIKKWISKLLDESPFKGLLPCESELSGNPYTPNYQVFAIFPNYAMKVVLEAIVFVAKEEKDNEIYILAKKLSNEISKGINRYLVSDGIKSNAPRGVWINGIDGRDGTAYDFSDWVKTSWPVSHWTRQLPFIILPDFFSYNLKSSINRAADLNSYEYIKKEMAKHPYFRKYGFISNTCWSGTGGRQMIQCLDMDKLSSLRLLFY